MFKEEIILNLHQQFWKQKRKKHFLPHFVRLVKTKTENIIRKKINLSHEEI